MAVDVKHVTVHATGQWWVVNTSPASGSPTTYTVMEGTESDADNLPGGGGVSGPYSSVSAANAVAEKEPQNANSGTGIPGLGVSPGGSYTGPLSGLLDWSLSFGNTTGLLTRILKVVFGGILIISGVLHMTGATEKVKTALGPAGMAVLAA